MADRILNWHIPNPGVPLPAFYMERDYTPEKVRIYAEGAPVNDFEVDIRDDGSTIFANRAASYQKESTVYSGISYNTLAVSTFTTGNPGERITGGTSGAAGWVISDAYGEMKLTLEGTTAFTAAETITGGTSSATAVVLSFYRGGVSDTLSVDTAETTAVLPKGANLEESADDFPDSVSPIVAGSILTCHLIEMGGASNVTVQLELQSLEQESEESD